MNIYQKIKAIMEDVQYLTKDDRVDTGKGRGYKAISEEKVTSTVRASMLKHGVVIVPIEMEHKRTDELVGERINRISTVDVRYRIQNADDSEDYIEAVSSGTGVDTQDKGVGKAMTYAYKYLLLRTFAIPTGEDPDKISSDIYTDELNKGKQDKQDKPQFTPNVYETDVTRLDALRKAVLKICGDKEALAEKAAQNKYGCTFAEMTEEQLTEVLESKRA